ncbi:hypothetical protein [Glutamicibacter sp. TV12E]|uniref:hypothetical protein n=1 Tax=Glutamicibacter sp. TV12E TaxID=3446362 RepID=UPI00403422DA
MSATGYAANQFLVILPDVCIDGDHEPTRIQLKSPDKELVVLVTAHTATSPLSAMARNLLSLDEFARHGPSMQEHAPAWQRQGGAFTPSLEGKLTVFEVIVPKMKGDKKYNDKHNSTFNWDDLSNPLVRASRGINMYLMALRVVFESTIPLLPGGHLQGPIYYRMCRVQEIRSNGQEAIRVKPLAEFAMGLGGTRAPEMESEVIFTKDKITEFELALQDLATGNKILSAKDRMVAAYTALHLQGDLTASCLESATASEMFLDTVLTMLLWESKVIRSDFSNESNILPDPKDVHLFGPTSSLTKRIKSNYNPLLGGEPWSIDDGVIGEWYKNCYLLRHRAIHGGYLPKFQECLDSLDSSRILVSFVLDALTKNKKKYPRSNWLLLGLTGLEKRNAYTNSYKKILSNIKENEPNWRLSYSSFRSDLSEKILGD